MKKDLARVLIHGIYSSLPKQFYETNQTVIKSGDDTWSSDLVDMNDYKSANNIQYRYISVVIDKFNKIGWTTPLKNKDAYTIKDAFFQILEHQNVNLISSKEVMKKSTLTKFSQNRILLKDNLAILQDEQYLKIDSKELYVIYSRNLYLNF